MTFKKLALVAALLIGSIASAVAAPNTNSQQGIQYDRAVDVGENGGGGGN
jgi:hypothetical protein